MAQLISIFVFFFLSLGFIGLYFFYKDRQAVKKEMLIERVSTKRSLKETRRIDLRRRRERSRAESFFSELIDIPRLGELLARSGTNLSVDRFLFIASASSALFALMAIILFRSFLPLVLMMGAGFFVPVLFLAYKKKKRDSALIEQLPGAIDFMVRALRAGQSLDRAFHGVGANFSDPIGGEIRIIYEEIAMGLPFTEALENFENRFPTLADVKFLCTSFIIQRETGGNLTEILDGLSRTIRQRFTLARQVKALSAEARLSSLIIGLLPVGFALLTYLFNPVYISFFFTDPTGQKLLFLALALEAAGFTIMRIMGRVDV